MLLRLTQLLIFVFLGTLDKQAMEIDSTEKRFADNVKIHERLASILNEANRDRRVKKQKVIASTCLKDLGLELKNYDHSDESLRKRVQSMYRNLVKFLWLGVEGKKEISKFIYPDSQSYHRMIREVSSWKEITRELEGRKYGYLEFFYDAEVFVFNKEGKDWVTGIYNKAFNIQNDKKEPRSQVKRKSEQLYAEGAKSHSNHQNKRRAYRWHFPERYEQSNPSSQNQGRIIPQNELSLVDPSSSGASKGCSSEINHDKKNSILEPVDCGVFRFYTLDSYGYWPSENDSTSQPDEPELGHFEHRSFTPLIEAETNFENSVSQRPRRADHYAHPLEPQILPFTAKYLLNGEYLIEKQGHLEQQGSKFDQLKTSCEALQALQHYIESSELIKLNKDLITGTLKTVQDHLQLKMYGA